MKNFSIKLGPHQIAVKFPEYIMDPNDRFCIGFFSLRDLTIQVQEGLTPSLTAETLMHELFHAIRIVYEIDDNNSEESKVQTMGIVMTTLIKENPKFLSYLQGLLHDSVNREREDSTDSDGAGMPQLYSSR